jgi:signal transduction histidine kinase
MTIVVFTFGAMSNLVSDPQSFRLSIPIPILQVIVFWVLQGGPGYSIGVAVVSALMLIFAVHGRMYTLFCESVLIRYEKDQLLGEVEAEKNKTEAALEAVQAANASKAFFMAAASHDIKQPLYAVGLLTDTLLMKPQPKETIEILEKQRRSIDRMNALFDDLMDVTRFEQGVFEIEVADFSSQELSQTLDDEFETLCAKKNLSWSIDVETAPLRTDLHLLIRLCRNLLTNALVFSSAGGIGCHATVKGSNLCFRIFDSGIGIAPENHGRVFDQFVRISDHQADRTGAGLGLTIVSHIRDALGIELEMESELGSGTEFTFAVPLANEVNQSALTGERAK